MEQGKNPFPTILAETLQGLDRVSLKTNDRMSGSPLLLQVCTHFLFSFLFLLLSLQFLFAGLATREIKTFVSSNGFFRQIQAQTAQKSSPVSSSFQFWRVGNIPQYRSWFNHLLDVPLVEDHSCYLGDLCSLRSHRRSPWFIILCSLQVMQTIRGETIHCHTPTIISRWSTLCQIPGAHPREMVSTPNQVQHPQWRWSHHQWFLQSLGSATRTETERRSFFFLLAKQEEQKIDTFCYENMSLLNYVLYVSFFD